MATDNHPDWSPKFRNAVAAQRALRIDGPRQTTHEQLVAMAEGLGMTFSQMDDYLGLKDGGYAKWVATAPRQCTQPGDDNAPTP